MTLIQKIVGAYYSEFNISVACYNDKQLRRFQNVCTVVFKYREILNILKKKTSNSNLYKVHSLYQFKKINFISLTFILSVFFRKIDTETLRVFSGFFGWCRDFLLI